jgi:hypothetical protein
MANISRIDIQIATANVLNAGTDGFVYVGVAGREFQLDASGNDFEQGANRVYTLGNGANILDAGDNDPRNPQLRTEDVDKFPKYVRFEPGGDWVLEDVTVTINPGTATQMIFRSPALQGAGRLKMSQTAGKFCYLA